MHAAWVAVNWRVWFVCIGNFTKNRMDNIFDVFDLDGNDNAGAKRKLNDDVKAENEENQIDENELKKNKIDPTLISKLVDSAKRVKNADANNSENLLESVGVSTDLNENLSDEINQFVPRVEIHELDTKGTCVHEVVIPTDLVYLPLRDTSESPNYKPAKEYKFVLDPFQKEAILCIENNQSVLGMFLQILLLKLKQIVFLD